MIEKKIEKFALRILFKYQNTESEARREIMYIYNRESLNSEINLKKHAESNQEFIEIGDILTLEGNECKVVNITFYLSEKMNNMEHRYGTNLLSPTETTNYNCQISVFVTPLEELE